MIHAQRCVVSLACFLVEQRIGGKRSGNGKAARLQRRHGGRDHGQIFIAHHAVFPGMGVQARHRQARQQDAEIAAQRGQNDFGRCEYGKLVDGFGHLRHRHVDGQGHHAQLVAGQHHHRARRAGQVRQEFGMAGKAKARALQHGLVDRRGDDSSRFARQAGFHGDFDGFDHSSAVGAFGFSRFRRGAGVCGDQGVLVTGEDAGIAHQPERMVADASAEMFKGRQRHLRADACRLAHGEEDRQRLCATGLT